MRSSQGRSSSVSSFLTIATAIFFVVSSLGAAAQAGSKPSGGGRTKRDTTPPAIAIAAPSNGATVSGTITVSGSASDNAGVASVTVKIDAGSAQAASGTSSWSQALDTNVYANGSHTITATATDTSGNLASASVAVNVNNVAPAPSPSPTPTPTPSPTGTPVATPAMPSGTLGGYAFQESDRDAVYETNETPLAHQHIYLYDGVGYYKKNTYSDAAGWYQFSGLADGSYRVQYGPDSWYSIRNDWIPDTVTTVFPQIFVQVSSTARADFGWRPIVRSTDVNAPISSYTGANGYVVRSYDDVVDARSLYDNLMLGSLVGAEGQFASLLFDLGSSTSTTASVAYVNGRWTNFHATSSITYSTWLSVGDDALFHEYGHAWSFYYAYIVQQDPTLAVYLQARGLTGDSRVGSSYMWNPNEMIAEDYRQLFGSPNAAAQSQMNTEIPPASQVPGLREFLSSTFTSPPAA
jgi:hypothetical protein